MSVAQVKWFQTKTHSASGICQEYQLRLLQEVHGRCWPAFLTPARGHRRNLANFPWHGSDQAVRHPSFGDCPKGAVFWPCLVHRSSSCARVWPALKSVSHRMCSSNQRFPCISTLVLLEKSKSLSTPTCLFSSQVYVHGRISFCPSIMWLAFVLW